MSSVRRISWVKAARRDFGVFPEAVQTDILDALTLVALGVMPAKAKPLSGIESGVFEIALRHRTDAFRAVYAIKIDADVWVVHAFQKKSKSGIATPKHEIDVIRDRLKRLREALA